MARLFSVSKGSISREIYWKKVYNVGTGYGHEGVRQTAPMNGFDEQSLRSEIVRVFPLTPRSADEDLFDSDDDEALSFLPFFAGRTWDRLDEVSEAVLDSALGFLRPSAFSYYVAFFLETVLADPQSPLEMALRQTLFPPVDRKQGKYTGWHYGKAAEGAFADRVGGLSEDQKAVVAKVFSFIATLDEPGGDAGLETRMSPSFGKALEVYWNRYLT